MVRTTPDDDHDRKLLADVESHGWHSVGIDDDPGGPAYVLSVGMFHALGHPEYLWQRSHVGISSDTSDEVSPHVQPTIAPGKTHVGQRLDVGVL